MAILLILGFVAAQGAAVFLTAFAALWLLKRRSGPAKVMAMLVSWFGWISVTITGYCLLGGEGGLMDGFGLLILLCHAAMVSSLVYLAVWLVAPGLWARFGSRS